MAVPKLRFKDENGADYPEWEKKKLRDILVQSISDGPHETPILVDEGVPFISVDAIVDGKIDFSRVRGYITKEYDAQCRKKYSPQKYDVYMVKSGSTTGDIAIADTDTYFNIWSPLAAMRTDSKKHAYFLFYLLHTSYIQNQVSSKMSNGTQPNLGMKALEKFNVVIPKNEEQHKIADFLTTFDKRITAQQNIIADMEEIKKGLLQKIFSQEIRFKDENGEEYPAWEKIKLGEICNIFKGASLSKSDISEDGTPFILYGELYTTYSEVAYDIVRKTDRIVDEKYFSKIGDVLVPTSGETAEEISTATCVMVKGVILAGDLNIIRSDVIDGRILSYMLNHEKKHDLAKVAQGASVVHSKADDIKKLKISIPSKDEQNKIASFLSAYDKKIEAEKKILADLQALKKGLLQQMFV